MVNFPSGLDRADGVSGYGGTITPNLARLAFTSSGNPNFFFEEDPDSPHIERAEQGTIVHKFKCDATTGYALIVGVARGTILTDSFGNLTKVLSNTMDWSRGDVVHITMVAESLSFDPPPDDFSYDVIEFNPALQKHPRYAPLTRAQIQQVRALAESQNYLATVDYAAILRIGSTDTNAQAATELLYKLRKGIDSFYLPGFRVTFSRYYYQPQYKNPGGYIEDPVDSGNLPAQFWQVPGQEPPDDNSFTTLARELFPMFYTNGITWLRLADTENYQRTWFRHTQSWIGAPAGTTTENPLIINGEPYQWRGHWDEDIYQPQFIAYNTNPNQ
jgi:hypothetical protein